MAGSDITAGLTVMVTGGISDGVSSLPPQELTEIVNSDKALIVNIKMELCDFIFMGYLMYFICNA
jgi:hypothetical protein